MNMKSGRLSCLAHANEAERQRMVPYLRSFSARSCEPLMKIRPFLLWLAGLALLWLAGGTLALGQTNPNTDQGMKPFDSFHGGALDSISVTSGNLYFHKTEYAAPQRGHVGLTFSLQYNNKGYRLQINCVNGSRGPWQMPPGSSPNPSNGGQGCTANYIWHWVGGGVQLIPDQSLFVQSQNTDTGANNGQGSEVFTMVYSAATADGSTHLLGNTGSEYRALDASGIRWDGTSVLTALDRNGTYGMFGGGSTDSNGNFVSQDSSNNYTDTLGRVIPPPPNFLATQTLPASTASLSKCPNLNLTYQPVVAAYTWNPPGPTGTSPFILCYATVYIRTALFGSGSYTNTTDFHDVSQSLNMLQSVVRPDGTTWTFVYDGANPSDTTSIAYGDLLKIGFPMGGSVTYTYGTEFPYQGQYAPNMQTTSSRSVETRSVDANDGTGPHTTKYTWGNVITATTTNYVVENTVSALGNDTVHQITGFFGGPALYETQTRFYQGSQASGTLLKTVNTDYSYSSNPFDALGPMVNPPTAINVVPKRVTTIWPNGQTSKVETDPDSGFTFHDPTWGLSIYPPQPGQSATYSGTLGTTVARREFDYGSGGAGNLLQQTLTTYFWQNNANYLAANLLDLPASVQVQDGAGNQVASTTYKYDEYTLNNSNITTQHNSSPTNGLIRGNLTSTHRWLNGSTTSTANCTVAVSNGFLVSYAQYNDTGTVSSSTDACGTKAGDNNHTTTHTYDSAYAGAYPTQTCNPLGQCVSATYDFSSGLTTSFTDANQQISNFTYDQQWRMTQALGPKDPVTSLRPETDFDYSVSNQVQRKKLQTANQQQQPPTPGSWIKDFVYFDGLGRTKKTQLVDPTEGDEFVDTTYDAMGRVSTVSNPHRSVSSPTDGITTSYYDALGRVTQVAPPDGTLLPSGTAVTQCQTNNSCTDYSGFPTITITDQAGKMRRSRSDARGQFVEVDEPGPGLNSPGTPATGTISVTGSLFSSTSTGTAATGSVTVSGSVQTMFISICNDTCIRQRKTDPGGTVSVTVNGHTNSVSYNGGSTANSIASALISQINGDGGAVIWASGPSCADTTDCTLTLQARTNGPNYSLSAQGLSNDEADGFSSFDTTSASGTSLTGGVYPVTTYDCGTMTVTVNGFQASASYNQNQNNTAQAMASALAGALNVAASPVNAGASIVNGTNIISLTSKAVSGNYNVSGNATASFAISSTTLGGGTGPGGLYAPYVTNYSYDPLGNLTQVSQKGDGSQAARVRTFTYDSLSDLLTTQNPESGTISYAYDADHNIVSKTAPQANQTGSATQTISYCYDVLNRVTGKGYGTQSCPLSSPAVSYIYDQGAYGIGHQNHVVDPAGTGDYTYDPSGRITGETRTIAGVSKSMSYGYYLDGELRSLTYPSGATVSYTPSASGRTLSAVDVANSFNYVTGATHTPGGSRTGFISGGAITNSFSYNPRLQPVNMSATTSSGTVFSINYDFHLGVGDNGNVFAVVNNKDASGNRNQSFSYDQLNRLASAQNAGTDCSQSTVNGKTKYWGNGYTYDPWGNLTDKGNLPGSTTGKCGSESQHVTPDAQNRMHVKTGADYQYDAAGNMTYDTVGQYYTYDQENRITGAGGLIYTYDADSNRVEKSTGGTSPTGMIYWYMALGIVAESDLKGNLQSEYVFFDGERVARRDNPSTNGLIYYYFTDNLKTTDVVTDAQGIVKNESDFYPFGGELQFLANDANHYKFTGKERDSETGLDYFGARYYSNGLGRFVTPDWSAKAEPVPFAKLENPQSLNLYSYVFNNPLSNIDEDGHACGFTLGNLGSGFCQRATEYGVMDANPAIRSQTRFFAAASAVSVALGDVRSWSIPRSLFVSEKTANFLEGIGGHLEDMNVNAATAIARGNITGPDLDARLVHMEQTEVQNMVDTLRQDDPAKYNQTITEINQSLNPGILGNAFGNIYATDRAYHDVLDGVRNDLGRDIDFSKQSDREAIGNVLIKHVRETGGCDLTGEKGQGCS
jgi:RHS repeat-associated protein